MTTSTTRAPACSVVVCTCNRPDALDRCLSALAQLAYPHFEVLVVDNAPSDGRASAVARRWGVRYLEEPTRGLSRARNTGACDCSSDVIAFTDDDAVPERTWLLHLAAPFRDPGVAVVTGRTLPLVDEVAAPIALDVTDLGPRTVRLDRRHPLWFEMASFGGVGNGNNMAFRRAVFERWSGFDERLGRGAPVSSGEEHRAFAQLIESGHMVVYTPDAVVRHPVPTTLEERREQYLRSRSDLAAYAVFLLLVTRHRWRVAKYVVEAALGARRTWRFHTEAVPRSIVSRARLLHAHVAGVRTCLQALTRSALRPEPVTGPALDIPQSP
ncbi:MAG: glycosyltransferase [Vicinamibacterales bacterium]